MAELIPIEVEITFSAEDKNWGGFDLTPFASTRSGELVITDWLVSFRESYRPTENVPMASVIPQALLHRVCETTYDCSENGGEHDRLYPVIMHIDGEEWTFNMRAIEREFEEIHYEIEVDGQWYSTADTYVSEFLTAEQLAIADREVMPQIEFGASEEVFAAMA